MRNSATGHAAGDPAPRVCILSEMFYPVVGGGETHSRLLGRHLNALGMTALAVTRRSDRSMPDREMVDGISVCRVPPSGPNSYGKYAMIPFASGELVRRRREYDAILVCGFRVLGMPAVIAARLLGKRCILRAESIGEMSGGYASAFGGLSRTQSALFRTWIRIRNSVLRKADACIAISKPIAEEFLSAGIDRRRIVALPNGIDTETYHPVDVATKCRLRADLGLPEDAVIVSYSGKLNRGKGLEHLLRAWVDIARHRPDAHLVLIGSGGGQSLSCEVELRSFAAENDLSSQLTFTGYVENVHEYLQASDLFAFPTENEAFGLSLVEAMSCGLPCVASRVGGVPEIISHGENGILVEPADHHALAQEIIRLISDPGLAERLSTNARRTVNERYSIHAVAAKYYEMISFMHTLGRTGWKERSATDARETRQESA